MSNETIKTLLELWKDLKKTPAGREKLKEAKVRAKVKVK